MHETAFNQLLNAPLKEIGYFNPQWSTTLTVDASPVGLGAVLRQLYPHNTNERQIVSFASRFLSETEQRYNQLEKEALAIVCACERLYLYLIGREFTLETDNRALKLIFSNPSSKPPLRLCRYSLRLSQFNFTLVHKPGLGNFADYLSRHPVDATGNDTVDEDYVNALLPHITPRALTIEDFASATNEDERLTLLAENIKAGTVPQTNSLKDYRGVFNELSLSSDGIILRDESSSQRNYKKFV